jgi:hypothetical protein
MIRRILLTVATVAAMGALSGTALADDPPQDLCVGIENEGDPICVTDEGGLTSIELPPINTPTAPDLSGGITQIVKIGSGVGCRLAC